MCIRDSFGSARIVDAADHSRTLALVAGQGASIGEVPPGMPRFDDDPIMHVEDSPDLPPLWEVFGGQRRPDGHWTLPELMPELSSPDAALHVGPQFVIHETAAIDMAAQLVGTDRIQPVSVHSMFMARGKTGPFRVDGQAVSGSDPARVAVHVTLHDEGNGDRLVSSASFVFDVTSG